MDVPPAAVRHRTRRGGAAVEVGVIAAVNVARWRYLRVPVADGAPKMIAIGIIPGVAARHAHRIKTVGVLAVVGVEIGGAGGIDDLRVDGAIRNAHQPLAVGGKVGKINIRDDAATVIQEPQRKSGRIVIAQVPNKQLRAGVKRKINKWLQK